MFDSELALAFINTRKDRPSGRVEMLSDPETATAWLADELGYVHDRPLSASEYDQLRALRDSAQRMLRARLADSPPPPGDLLLLNRASAAAPRSDQLDREWHASLCFTESGSVDPQDLAELHAALASAAMLLAAESSADLAECGADDCVVLFLRTDPRQRWHSERCGNRMRAARSYARHRSQPTQEPRAS